MSVARKGKTYEEIFGKEKAAELKKKRASQMAAQNRAKAGSKLSEETRLKMSSKIWITDGYRDKRHLKTEAIPENWRRGRSNGVKKKGDPFFSDEEAKAKARVTKINRYGDPNYNGSNN